MLQIKFCTCFQLLCVCVCVCVCVFTAPLIKDGLLGLPHKLLLTAEGSRGQQRAAEGSNVSVTIFILLIHSDNPNHI